MDPALAAPETRKTQAALASATAVIEEWERSRERPTDLTERDIRAALTQAGGLVRLLQDAGRVDRAALYRALRLNVRYEKQASTGVERVHARLLLRRSGGRI